MAPRFDIRRLGRDELGRVEEIDRAEHIDVLYLQDGERLVERPGSWDSSAWERDGRGQHSVEARVRELHRYVDHGGIVPMGHPLDELVQLEPDDVHMHKEL